MTLYAAMSVPVDGSGRAVGCVTPSFTRMPAYVT